MPGQTISARLSLAALAATGLLASACERAADQDAAATAESPPALPIAPTPPPPLTRADLLEALDAAASAYAAGDAETGEDLSRRRFVVRQAFGCSGPRPPAEGAGDGLAGWSWGPERKTINISLTPGDWTHSALIAGAAADWEAVEGFWLPHPWMRADGCPRVRTDPLVTAPAAPSPESMGLAAVFETGGSRLGRRNGRAYTFSIRGEGDRPLTPPIDGYRLVLEGRLTTFGDGRVIGCRSVDIEQRPVCIAAAHLERVAFEDAGGTLLGEWRPG